MDLHGPSCFDWRASLSRWILATRRADSIRGADYKAIQISCPE